MSRFARSLRALAVAAFLAVALPAHADDVVVFAAASLKPALDTLLESPEAKAIGKIRPSYGASSQLARQIEAGAPAAVFVSADRDWMDYVAQKDLVEPGTRVDLLGNALVVVAPKESTATIDVARPASFAAALGDGRLAMAEPNSVPAGKYGKAALTKLGIWSGIEARVVAADNVRAALNFVVRGEAPLGIVYRSDAVSEPTVRIVATFPADSHETIVYPLALVRGHVSDAAKNVHALLRAPAARAVFQKYGFDVVDAAK